MKALVQRAIAVAGEPLVRLSRPAGIQPPVSRAAFRSMIKGDALELGAFDYPFLPNAYHYDIIDRGQLQARAIEHGRNPDSVPEIHYSGRLSDIDRSFDAVVSSHVIEHTPDLIGHLEGVAGLLNPRGAYFVIVPDKRFSFDHFLSESTLAEVETGKGRASPTKKAIRDHRLRTTHNFSPFHWVGIHGQPTNDTLAVEKDMEALSRGEYVDVHQWTFTPSSFARIVSALGIFHDVTVYDTAFGDLEFKAVLSLAETPH